MLHATSKRTFAVLVALVCTAALVPAAAQACSCVPGNDLAARLARGELALVGEVVAAQRVGEPPADGRPELDLEVAYTVRVERAFNAELGAETTIVARTNGGTCGFTWTVGQRVGAFIGRHDDAWGTSLCSLADPARLIAAADTPPPTEPPVTPSPVTPPPTTPPTTPPTGANPRAPAPAPTLRARHSGRVAAGGPRAGTGLDRLPAKAGERIRLRLDAPARSVRFALARADGKRLGGLRSASAVAGARRKAWTARLPRLLPARADRLLVTVDYGAGKRATFAVGLGKPAGPSAVTALAALAPPCPALL